MIVTKHPYRFLNQKLQAGISGPTKAILFSYNCAQDNKIKKKSIKVDDNAKHHDRPHMPTFSCESLEDPTPGYLWHSYCQGNHST